MNGDVESSTGQGGWEELFIRSVEHELGRTGQSLRTRLRDGSLSVSVDAKGIVDIRGAFQWRGAWDVSSSLVAPYSRAGAWIVVASAEDVDDRVEALMMETAHAAALRGHTLRMVAVGEPRRGWRGVQHALPGLGADDLVRLAQAMRAVIRVESSSGLLTRLAARTGRGCIGIGPGAGGDRCIGSFSSIELVDVLDQTFRAEPLDEPFVPELIAELRDRMHA